MITLFRQYKSLQFILLLVIFYLLNHFIAPSDNNLLWRLPAALSWFPLYINDSISYLMFEWWPIDVYDPDIEEFEEKPVVREITRVLSGFILFFGLQKAKHVSSVSEPSRSCKILSKT